MSRLARRPGATNMSAMADDPKTTTSPACSAHEAADAYMGFVPREELVLFLNTLLEAERETGVHLTESFAMWPASSVCGYYFSHPQARYFGVGKIGADQVQDYAARKGVSAADILRWVPGVVDSAAADEAA